MHWFLCEFCAGLLTLYIIVVHRMNVAVAFCRRTILAASQALWRNLQRNLLRSSDGKDDSRVTACGNAFLMSRTLYRSLCNLKAPYKHMHYWYLLKMLLLFFFQRTYEKWNRRLPPARQRWRHVTSQNSCCCCCWIPITAYDALTRICTEGNYSYVIPVKFTWAKGHHVGNRRNK